MLLLDALKLNRDSGVYPMHMPGHKRNPEFMPKIDVCGIDITEIDGFDSLHDANGILRSAMDKAAELYHSQATYFLVNGCTCGILAAVSACTSKGDRVLMARNCHKAVYNAVSLMELEAIYLQPPWNASFGMSGSIEPDEVKRALQEYGNISLIIITSPTYEGVISDIRAISELAHSRGIPILVDEAHGAHLGFSPGFPSGSIDAGADLVVHGIHKTLPSPTQTALLHVNGSIADPERVRRQLSVFQSSSPSYLLMAGIDQCIALLSGRGEECFTRYLQLLYGFDRKMTQLEHLEILCKGKQHDDKHAEIFDFDPGKIVISAARTGLTGKRLSEIMLHKYRIQLEMAMGNYALAMTSIADTGEGFDRLASAIIDIDSQRLGNAVVNSGKLYFPLPESVMPIFEAIKKRHRFVPLQESIGCVSAEYVYPYPPGVPLLVPGDTITGDVIDAALLMASSAVSIVSTYNRMPEKIATIEI